MTDAIEIVAEAAVKGFWAKYRLVAIAAGAVAVLVALALVWWLVFIRPASAQRDAKVAQATGAVAVGGQQSAHQAIDTIVKRQDGDVKIDNQTRANNVTILKAAGAGDPVNPAVDDAGRRAICMYKSSADLPDCKRLLQPNP